MDLIDADGVSTAHKGIKDIFTELLALNDDFFALRVEFRVEHSQRINSVSLFGNPRGDRARVKAVEASSTHN